MFDIRLKAVRGIAKESIMNKIIGASMIVAGIILGIYVGVWVCFIGGIVGIIKVIRAPELIAMDVAINVGKIMLSGLATWVSVLILAVPGFAIFSQTKRGKG